MTKLSRDPKAGLALGDRGLLSQLTLTREFPHGLAELSFFCISGLGYFLLPFLPSLSLS